MKRIVRALMVSALAAMMAVGLSGCQGYPSVEEALQSNVLTPVVSSGATIEPGVLTVGIDSSRAPYAWSTNSAAITVQGIDIDVALKLGEQMGLGVKFVNVGKNYSAAVNGACDIIMGMVQANMPDASQSLVGGYSDSAPAVFGRNVSATVTVQELQIARIGVSNPSQRIYDVAPDATYVTFDSLNDAFAALENGQVDYVACDSFMGGYLAKYYTDISMAGALDLPSARGIAVATADSELVSAVSSAMDALSANGELRSIRTKWVGNLASITTTNQVSTAPEATSESDEAQPAA